jgi:hypothetical protein
MDLVGQAADFINSQVHEGGWGMDSTVGHIQVLNLEKQAIEPFGHLGVEVWDENIRFICQAFFHALDVCPEMGVSLAE